MKRGKHTFLWYPQVGSDKSFTLFDVVSKSLPMARRHVLKHLRKNGYKDGELWTISTEKKPLPNQYDEVGIVDIEPHARVPSWWAERMRSGWLRTEPICSRYDELA